MDYLERKPNAAEIQRTLEAEFGEGAVSVRWVQDLVEFFWTDDPSEPWSLGDARSDDATYILPTLRWLIRNTGRKQLTRGEAQWVARVQRAAPDLEPGWVFKYARAYLARHEHEESTADLDAWLAFGPWRSKEARDAYADSIRKKTLEALPLSGSKGVYVSPDGQVTTYEVYQGLPPDIQEVSDETSE